MSFVSVAGRDPLSGRCLEIVVEDGLIADVRVSERECDRWLSAGLVDLQVNGYLGFDLNGAGVSVDVVSSLTRALVETGVTTFAPTVITASEEAMIRSVECVAEAMARDRLAEACIPYVHMEGPHISPVDGYRGAHPLESVREPSIAEFERWQEACGGLVGLVTMSPHFPGSVEYIGALVECGVHVAIGHTHASEEEIHAAVEAGARLSTHLGNGIVPLLERHPNPIWSQLAEDRLTATFIADGHHLPGSALKAMMRARGTEQCVLVSDAVALAGMPPGRYTAAVGGEVELSADGRLSMVGSRTLAGAAVPLITCVGRAVKMTGRSLAEVLAMATVNPGRFAGGRGSLRVSERADLTLFRWDEKDCVLSVDEVWVGGERVFGSVVA
jgi:N-acetylglucosamine-6-phosphate deacetylase